MSFKIGSMVHRLLGAFFDTKVRRLQRSKTHTCCGVLWEWNGYEWVASRDGVTATAAPPDAAIDVWRGNLHMPGDNYGPAWVADHSLAAHHPGGLVLPTFLLLGAVQSLTRLEDLKALKSLEAEYESLGKPHVGHITSGGVTRIPDQILGELGSPDFVNVTWARLQHAGAYAFVTLKALRAAEDTSTSAPVVKRVDTKEAFLAAQKSLDTLLLQLRPISDAEEAVSQVEQALLLLQTAWRFYPRDKVSTDKTQP